MVVAAEGAPEAESRPDPRRDPDRHGGQPLPVRRLQRNRRRVRERPQGRPPCLSRRRAPRRRRSASASPGRPSRRRSRFRPGIRRRSPRATPRRVFGGRQPRLDGRFKATGRAVYTHDVRRTDLLYGRILRSPHAHARILSVDTSTLARMPGVVFELLDKKEVRYQGDAGSRARGPLGGRGRRRPPRRRREVRRPPPRRHARGGDEAGRAPRLRKAGRGAPDGRRRAGGKRRRRADRKHPRAPGLGTRREGSREALRRGGRGGRALLPDAGPDPRLHGDAFLVRRVEGGRALRRRLHAGGLLGPGRAGAGVRPFEGQGPRHRRVRRRRIRVEVRRRRPRRPRREARQEGRKARASSSSTGRKTSSRPETAPIRSTG